MYKFMKFIFVSFCNNYGEFLELFSCQSFLIYHKPLSQIFVLMNVEFKVLYFCAYNTTIHWLLALQIVM